MEFNEDDYSWLAEEICEYLDNHEDLVMQTVDLGHDYDLYIRKGDNPKVVAAVYYNYFELYIDGQCYDLYEPHDKPPKHKTFYNKLVKLIEKEIKE